MEFFSLLFLPGLAALALFDQLKTSNLVTLLARSYGISLALNSLAMFITIAVVYSTILSPLDTMTRIHFYFLPSLILVLSILLVLVFGLIRFRSVLRTYRPRSIRKGQLLALFLGVFFGGLILSQFIKYPVFPKSYSVDFIQHYQLMQELLRNYTGGPEALLYYGVHYNLALGYLLVGGDSFIQIQYLMSILAAPSSLLVYEVVNRLYNSTRLAIFGQVVFIGTGFLWYIPLYNTGLFPNLYAIILALAYLLELKQVIDGNGVLRLGTFAIVVIGLYFSHYFAPLFIVAVIVSLIVASALRVVRWRRALPSIIITLAPVGLLLLKPSLFGFFLKTLGQTGSQGGFTFTTPFADLFSFSPFVRYSIALIYNYGSLVIFFGLPLSLYYLWRHRKDSWMLFVLPIWFALLWVTAPNGELSWRFSFEALAPLILLAPATFDQAPKFAMWLLGRDKGEARTRLRTRPTDGFSMGTAFIVGFLFLLVVGGSWTNIMVSDLALDTDSYSRSQTDLYSSMIWFAQNTPSGSSLLTTTDWRISFLPSIIGRDGQLLLFAPASDAVAYARAHGYGYLLVTYFIPENVPEGSDLSAFYGSFSQNQNLKMIYQNGQDFIYQIVK